MVLALVRDARNLHRELAVEEEPAAVLLELAFLFLVIIFVVVAAVAIFGEALLRVGSN